MRVLERALAAYVAAVDAEGLAAHGVNVLVGDETVEHRWRSDDRVDLHSVSKGVAALAVGMAVDEGLLALETTAGELLPELATGRGCAAVTVRQLLTMTSGIDFAWFAQQPVPWPDIAGEMLGRDVTGTPGATFQYSDASTYVVLRMLRAATSVDVRDWLLPRLFEPLGIDDPQWRRCPLGHPLGGSGLLLRTSELGRTALLLRDEGAWQGRQLVSPRWIRAMHAADPVHPSWTATGAPSASDFHHYGLAIWEGPADCWRLDGLYGQYVVIDAASAVAVAITAHEEARDARLVELVAEVLLPQL
ncbi:serine hydrolase domain-containing protein [Agrococcus sp. ARC_14]|uniref:serine hydrolase domain-containing protein n=1 Tax=Agrococcus sp. ARC_14 TaxID=2919927 RepID=UPI001F06EAFE|nr:serine hydrolase domain-containing protein [Agrococcus sp. ARC_14]MCH1881585.1 beta-lactamase family protein [Agrococcus sp. ARC_14]